MRKESRQPWAAVLLNLELTFPRNPLECLSLHSSSSGANKGDGSSISSVVWGNGVSCSCSCVSPFFVLFFLLSRWHFVQLFYSLLPVFMD